MSIIIYIATNKINQKIYIGQTSHSLSYRKNIHEQIAKRNSPYRFHKALRKYGFENFSWRVLDEVSKEDASAVEASYIDMFSSYFYGIGYNSCANVPDLGPTRGRSITHSGSFKKGQVAWNKGKTMPEDFKQKCSEAKKGKPTGRSTTKDMKFGPKSEEAKQKISEANKGRKRTPEMNKANSERMKGNVPWNKGKKGLQTAWNKGLKMKKDPSEEKE